MDIGASISSISEHTIEPGTESVLRERDSEVLQKIGSPGHFLMSVLSSDRPKDIEKKAVNPYAC